MRIAPIGIDDIFPDSKSMAASIIGAALDASSLKGVFVIKMQDYLAGEEPAVEPVIEPTPEPEEEPV